MPVSFPQIVGEFFFPENVGVFRVKNTSTLDTPTRNDKKRETAPRVNDHFYNTLYLFECSRFSFFSILTPILSPISGSILSPILKPISTLRFRAIVVFEVDFLGYMAFTKITISRQPWVFFLQIKKILDISSLESNDGYRSLFN